MQLRRTTYRWAGWSFVVLGLFWLVPVVAHSLSHPDLVSSAVVIAGCSFQVVLGLLFVRRAGQVDDEA